MRFAHPEAEKWFHSRTFGSAGRDPVQLAALKRLRKTRVSVCLPALNEEATIGHICSCISDELVAVGLVDELVVVDSGSHDATVSVARDAGARVHMAADLTPLGPEIKGKGDVLWRSLAAVTGDLVAWVDSDIRNFDPGFVTGLLEPLLTDDALQFVKGYYLRPLQNGSGGARVTEVLVRPLVGLVAPELSGFLQPLAGEFAGRRDALGRVPFLTGYGVDIGLLLDMWKTVGLDALAQADLGTRMHRPRPLAELGRMSFEVLQAMLSRLDAMGRVKLADDVVARLVQFDDDNAPYACDLQVVQRPPAGPA